MQSFPVADTFTVYFVLEYNVEAQILPGTTTTAHYIKGPNLPRHAPTTQTLHRCTVMYATPHAFSPTRYTTAIQQFIWVKQARSVMGGAVTVPLDTMNAVVDYASKYRPYSSWNNGNVKKYCCYNIALQLNLYLVHISGSMRPLCCGMRSHPCRCFRPCLNAVARFWIFICFPQVVCRPCYTETSTLTFGARLRLFRGNAAYMINRNPYVDDHQKMTANTLPFSKTYSSLTCTLSSRRNSRCSS